MSKGVIVESQHTNDWIVPRRVMCAFFWVGIILLFTGIILLVTSKHKKEFYESWGAVLLGLGFCLLLICFILCMHAYCVITVADDETSNPSRQPQEPRQPVAGTIQRAPLKPPPNFKLPTSTRQGNGGWQQNITDRRRNFNPGRLKTIKENNSPERGLSKNDSRANNNYGAMATNADHVRSSAAMVTALPSDGKSSVSILDPETVHYVVNEKSVLPRPNGLTKPNGISGTQYRPNGGLVSSYKQDEIEKCQNDMNDKSSLNSRMDQKDTPDPSYADSACSSNAKTAELSSDPTAMSSSKSNSDLTEQMSSCSPKQNVGDFSRDGSMESTLDGELSSLPSGQKISPTFTLSSEDSTDIPPISLSHIPVHDSPVQEDYHFQVSSVRPKDTHQQHYLQGHYSFHSQVPSSHPAITMKSKTPDRDMDRQYTMSYPFDEDEEDTISCFPKLPAKYVGMPAVDEEIISPDYRIPAHGAITTTHVYSRPIASTRVTQLSDRRPDVHRLIPNGSPPQLAPGYHRQYPITSVHAYPIRHRPPHPYLPLKINTDYTDAGNPQLVEGRPPSGRPPSGRVLTTRPELSAEPSGMHPPQGPRRFDRNEPTNLLGGQTMDLMNRGLNNSATVYLNQDQDFSESVMSIYDNLNYIRI